MSKYATRVALLLLCGLPLFSAAAITRTWVGAVSSNFSDPNNWSPAGAPAPADSLLFPAGSNGTMTNDLPAGTSFGPMTFSNDTASMVLSGNPLTLTGDVTVSGSFGSFLTCNADLKIGTSLALGNGRYNGAIDVNGQTLTLNSGFNQKVTTLNGTGTVISNGALITGGGTFSGTISGTVELDASLPNASLVNHGSLAGTGTIGNVDAGSVSPGACCSNPYGVLTTKSLVIGSGAGAHFDLNPANPSGESDSIHVTGTVTLNNPSFSVSLPAGGPTAGQQFTVIDNDGSDPVSGTFSGLPEGAVFDVNGADFSISYHGGDGNDVVLTVTAVVKTWVGAVSSLWSDPQNWKPGAIPQPGEPLLFPTGSNATMTNDLPAGTSFGPMTFSSTNGFTLSGNPLTLTADVNVSNAFLLTWNADVKIGSSLTFSDGNPVTFNGAVDVNGQTLTITGYAPTVNALNGSGTVVAAGNGITITGGGTFNGTISGTVEIDGSLPNASLVSPGSLAGKGTIGTADARSVSPGACCQNPFGILTTKSLTVGGTGASAHFDLNPANPSGESDSVHVTGTVTLNNPELSVGLPSGGPTAGQQFTIIDNDGSDPVNGTFSGLPEGAVFDVNGADFSISYHGGDGNDVVLTVTAVVKTWVGALDSLWSNPLNWKPGVVPQPGEPLLFPASSNGTMTNDLPAGMSFGPMTFNNGGILSGNPLTLTADVTINAGSLFTWNADIKIGSPLTFNTGNATPINGAIDVNGQTLTILNVFGTKVNALNGSGTLVANGVTITGAGTFSGTISGNVEVDGSIPNASIVNPGSLSGKGTIGNVDARSISPGACCQNPFGILTTKSLSVGGTGASAHFDVNPANPSGESDSIHVTGSVTLGNPELSVGVPVIGGVPSIGQTFIIIDNDGSDPVAGTFAGLPEGATVSAGAYLFRITYAGGDGNDVVLTAATQPDIVASQNVASSVVGQTITLGATLSSPFGTPTGTVTFLDDGESLGVAPVVNGSASLDVALMTAGSHSITAFYSGGGTFVSATSAPLTHFVARGETTTTFAGASNTVYGQTEIRTLTLPAPPATGVVTGGVTLAEGPNAIGTVSVSGGSAIFDASALKPGTHTLTATYSGSESYNGSSSSAFQVTVSRAATHVEATADGSVLKIFILPIGNVADVPTGTVTITENGNVIAQQAIAGNLSLNLALAPGHHTLHVSYSGDTLFQESSMDVEINGTAPSRHRAVRH